MKDFFKFALIRAIRTMAQTMLSMFSVGMAVNEIDWGMLVSVSIIAGFYSILTSITTGLPEAENK